jgi:hypothetical protein
MMNRLHGVAVSSLMVGFMVMGNLARASDLQPSPQLGKLIATLNQAYSDAGRDNNGIDATTVTHRTFQNLTAHKSVEQFETIADLQSTIRDCLLMKEGAYGDHLSRSTQRRLVRDFTRKILLHSQIHFLNLARVDDLSLSGGILASSCSLAVRETQGNQEIVTILQSYTHD